MCGRKFSDESLSWSVYRDQLNLFADHPPSNFAPNYNIAPTHMVPVCLMEDGNRVLRALQWGLLPFWAKEKKVGYSMINAKAETLEEKRSFSPLLKSKRCVVPVSGFYEWQRKSKTDKQAFAISRVDDQPLLLAGLWASNSNLEVETYTVITRAPNEFVAQVHNRMPAILEKDDVDTWLDGEWRDALPLLQREVKNDVLRAYPVSNDVGKVANNYASLIEPVGPALTV